MKKLVLVVFLLFLCGGCAARRKVPIYFPQISSPAAERAGVAFYGTPFQISNSSPFFCRLIAGGKDLGTLGPGEIVFDLRHWHNLWYQNIPVAAVCYRNAAATDYIGAAGRILVLGGYTPAEWIIRPGEIRTPDGKTPAPTTAASPTSRRIKLPREWWASSTGIQVVNNTTSDIAILINGKPVATIGTGGVDYVRAELVGGYSRPLIITITAGAGCTYTEQVWVQRNVQWARQIVFGPEYCGWNRWR
jgi:hypothetical protein